MRHYTDAQRLWMACGWAVVGAVMIARGIRLCLEYRARRSALGALQGVVVAVRKGTEHKTVVFLEFTDATGQKRKIEWTPLWGTPGLGETMPLVPVVDGNGKTQIQVSSLNASESGLYYLVAGAAILVSCFYII